MLKKVFLLFIFVIIASSIERSRTPKSIEFQCGRKGSSSGLSIGGKVTKKNDWPWVAALINPSTQKFFCGGSIISKNHVLTAAHCIQDKGIEISRSPEDVIAYLGKHDLNLLFEKGSEIFSLTPIGIGVRKISTQILLFFIPRSA